MASIAAQLAFHPVITQSLQVGSTTLGRDKAYRFVQYFARLYSWWLLSRGHKDAGAQWTALKAHLGTARKLLRLGKPIEHLQAALKAVKAGGQPAEQLTTIARQVGYFGFLFADSLIWAQAIKFTSFKADTAQKITKASYRFWVAGILFSIVNSGFKLARFSKESRLLKSSSTETDSVGEKADATTKLRTLQVAQVGAREQLLADFLDIWIPASALGLANVNEGVLGVFGMITSYMALQKQWAAAGSK